MSKQSANHWDSVYSTKAPDAVSWYAPHLETSFGLIKRVAPKWPAIIDVGGGESTLADDLLAEGYRYITVLDLSAKAIEVSKKRFGAVAIYIDWRVGDVLTADLPRNYYDVWHDRAVFHFLTSEEDRRAYVEQVARSVKPGGHVIVATFGPEGPNKCSGLDVVRYDADALHSEFGKSFRLLDSHTEVHHTPWGADQQFLYCLCRVESGPT
jgi:2-polyprenyl-3-methyl-5-hydroxy-6-metoxy-1,4-benzoquinol methylase